MIYFIQAGNSGPIKIGITQDLPTRLAALRTGQHEQLEVIGVRNGDRKEEAQIHSDLANFRINNEWFSPSPEVLDFIKENSFPYSDSLSGDSKEIKDTVKFVKMPASLLLALQDKTSITFSVVVRRLIEKYLKGEVGLD